MQQKEKIKFFKEALFEMYPNAVTELEYSNEFQLLIAIIMSAQTTDKQVNKVNKIFFEVFKTPEDWINLWEEKIREYIRSVSFFNNKAKNIYKTCILLKSIYNSIIPKQIELLTGLPWVGIKTAKVFLSIIENASFLWVDTHVHRVLNRVWFVKTKTPLQTDKEAEKIFTSNDLSFLHHTLIFFWRYHCVARKPKCTDCKIKSICEYFNKK